MTNLTWLILRGNSSFLPEITSRIVCTWPAGFVFTGITELHVSSLAFISCGHSDSAAVNIISVQESNISNCSFHNSVNTNRNGCDGGALYIWNSSVLLTGNIFQNNFAAFRGGVLYVNNSKLTVTDNIFQNDSAGHGGVLYVEDSTFTISDNTFRNNFAAYGSGGVLDVLHSNFTVMDNIFHNNSAANESGGVLFVWKSILTVTNNSFHSNSAFQGGVLYLWNSNLTVTESTFQSNSADTGGAVHATCSTLDLLGNIFQKNVGTEVGGAILFDRSYCLTNRGSIMRMYGNNIIDNNRAEYGGGIAVLGIDTQVEIKLEGNTTIKNCKASYGGRLYVHNTQITGNMTLANNLATEGGGGMYVSRSIVNFVGKSTTVNNSAENGNGGGLLLSHESQFYLQPNTRVYFIRNRAKSNGGAIMVAERDPFAYCNDFAASHYDLRSSHCFFQINPSEKYKKRYTPSEIKTIIDELKVGIYFDNNSAEAGADLYGGLVDDCTLSNIGTLSTNCRQCPSSGNVFDDIIISENTPDISSGPLYICTCRDKQTDCTGSYHHPEPVYPGGTLEVPVIARGQRNGTTPAVIQVIDMLTDNITIQKREYTQYTTKDCNANTLKYTIQSSAENSIQGMILYAKGLCPPTAAHTLNVSIKIQQCPPGFQLSHDKPTCICAERLQQFTSTCLIDNRTLLRAHNADFWVGYNQSRGLVIHPHCPFDYCTSNEIYFAVNDSDKQCNYNRSGLLCGRCRDDLSLALGNSHCLHCSNSYLALLTVFVFAGIALVILLLVLRLTVAAGTINGLIFYANVVAVNSAIFFQAPSTNVPRANILTVFIAWLNLDLGIETCFYNGMDAYVKTWLQFAFPLYVWALVGMIIIGSHYSGRVAKVFGSNPVAVLATLFLLSYAKLLRTVIGALSFAFLEYPNNSHIAVWLYDGNIRYLYGKHIPLFIVAMVFLVFLFSPYMMLLTFSQWLQAKSKFNITSWINGPKVKPFLDAYHAPHTDKHRYWTGLMLLLRFVLYLIFAVNTLGDPCVNLLAIASSTVAILTFTTLSTKIYKTWSLGLLETSFILNLTILAMATLYIRPSGENQNVATFTSVGIAFVTFAGIVIYHSIQQIKDTRLWRRVCLRHDYMRISLDDGNSGPEDPPDLVLVPGIAPTQTVVYSRNFELRESCMATN